MRSPQPEQKVRVRLMIAKAKSVMLLRGLRGRRMSPAAGNRRRAQKVEGVGSCLSAVVLGVVMVRVKFGAAPGGREAGLKEAVARLGRPVAARAIGLARLP